jgi:rubrerythrin
MTEDRLFGFPEGIPGQLALDTDSYYVCERCAHFWSQPFDPDRCENCGHDWLEVCDTLEAAEDASEAVLERRDAR